MGLLYTLAMRLGAVLIVLLVAACGDDWKPAPDGIHGGSRLHARFLAADGGARQFLTFHDTELDVDCAVGEELMRCLPNFATDLRFADAACTTQIVVEDTGACTELYEYAAEFSFTDCTMTLEHAWRRGARRDEAVSYTRAGDGTCIEQPIGADQAGFDLGEEIPIDRFVAAQLEETGDERLHALDLVTEDGARLPLGLRDSMLGVRCDDYNGDVDRCVPHAAYSTYYVDDACSVPVGEGTSCEGDPAFVQQFTYDACEWTVEVLRVTGAVTPTALWDASGDTCFPSAVTAGDYWSTGEVVPLDSLPVMQPGLFGNGRLQGKLRTSGDVVRPAYDFHDTELDVDCSPTHVGGDELRCIPYDVGYAGAYYYADDACTQQLTLVDAGSVCGAAPAPPRAARATQEGGSCTSQLNLFALGDEVLPGTIYQQDLDSCTVVDWDRSTLRRYALGAALDWDVYALLREESD